MQNSTVPNSDILNSNQTSPFLDTPKSAEGALTSTTETVTQTPITRTTDPSRPAFMTAEQHTMETPQTTPTNTTSSVNTAPIPAPIPPIETPPSEISNSTGNGGANRSGNIKKIAAGLGVIVLLAATATGVFIFRNSQLSQTQAWDCAKYNFSVSRDGAVTVINGSTENVPPNKATVKIDAIQVASFDVPTLAPGQSSKLGDAPVPATGAFVWEVAGSANCSDGGSYQAAAALAQCIAVSAFTPTWEQLTSSQLSELVPGDKIRFVATTTTTEGVVDKVRFSINGTTLPEVDTTKPGSNDFYDEYTIPQGIKDFKVTVEMHHQESDTWY